MTEIFTAFFTLLSQIGIPVYPENGVPSDAVFPYLSWSALQLDWRDSGIIPVRIWDRSENYNTLMGLAEKFAALVGDGQAIPTDSGFVYLAKGAPWAQTQPLQDSEIKVMYFNLDVQTLI